jgi:hypothetical protein
METAQWLNRNVLIGYTDQRGTAWHYRATAQGASPTITRVRFRSPTSSGVRLTGTPSPDGCSSTLTGTGCGPARSGWPW